MRTRTKRLGCRNLIGLTILCATLSTRSLEAVEVVVPEVIHSFVGADEVIPIALRSDDDTRELEFFIDYDPAVLEHAALALVARRSLALEHFSVVNSNGRIEVRVVFDENFGPDLRWIAELFEIRFSLRRNAGLRGSTSEVSISLGGTTRLNIVEGDAFKRGDADRDGAVGMTDAITVLSKLFLGATVELCDAQSDSDGDYRVTISDAIYILRHLYQSGPRPPRPEACGVTADEWCEPGFGC